LIFNSFIFKANFFKHLFPYISIRCDILTQQLKESFLTLSIPKFFNTGGPSDPLRHYLVPSVDRVPFVRQMVEDGLYFVLKAPYQSGKTTLAKELIKEINLDGRFYALYLNLHELKDINNLTIATRYFLDILIDTLRLSKDPILSSVRFRVDNKLTRKTVKDILTYLCLSLDKPLVLIVDNIYSLPLKTLVFFLDAFFSGFVSREKYSFPHSVLFLSIRDLFDLTKRGDNYGKRLEENLLSNLVDKLGSNLEENRFERGNDSHRENYMGGTYNIFKSVRLPNFSFADISTICDEHNAATGQNIDDAAKLKIWDLSEGQPFLVNALISEAIDFVLHGDLGKSITSSVISEAALNIAKERPGHIRCLMTYLKDPKVQRVVGETLSGVSLKRPIFEEGALLALDLGLISSDQDDYLRPANLLYQDLMLYALTEHIVLPRSLSGRFLEKNAVLISPLLLEFQRYWKERSFSWLKPFPEIPHTLTRLSLLVFLQRALEDKVILERNSAIKEDSIILTLSCGGHCYPIFVTLASNNLAGISLAGIGNANLEQDEISNFMDAKGVLEAWVVSFDLNASKSPEEKIYWKTKTLSAGRIIHTVGL
jgi:hypothetical protein